MIIYMYNQDFCKSSFLRNKLNNNFQNLLFQETFFLFKF